MVRVVAVVVLLAMLVACAPQAPPTGNGGAAPPTPPGPGPGAPPGANGDAEQMVVRVVTMTPMSGPDVRMGIRQENSLAAAEQHMAEDNFLTPAYRIDFIRPFIDDLNSTDGAPIAANLAIAMDPHAVIGHHFTTMILISGPMFEEAGIPLFGMVSGPASVQQGWDYFHIGTVTDIDAGVVLGDYIVNELGVTNVLVMARNDEGGMAGAEGVMDRIDYLTGTPMDRDRHYMLFAIDDIDFTAHAMRARDLGVEAVLTYGLNATQGIIAYDQIEQIYGPIPDTVLFAGSTAFGSALMPVHFTPDKLQGIFFPTGYIMDPSCPMRERFRLQWNANDPEDLYPGDNDARVYDAAWNIAAALNLLYENDGPLHPDNDPNFRSRLNHWIRQLDRQGVQGHINYAAFDDGRMLATGSVAEWQAGGYFIRVFPH